MKMIRLSCIFVRVCEPSNEIQHYACRQSGKKEYDHLKDLPEKRSISFQLSARCYGPIPRRTSASSADKRSPDRWWITLAEGDEAREKLFNKLSKVRVFCSGRTRIAVGRALAYIRTYHFNLEKVASSVFRLLPSKKKPFFIEGIKANSITKEDPVIKETECVEDKVEDLEEA